MRPSRGMGALLRSLVVSLACSALASASLRIAFSLAFSLAFCISSALSLGSSDKARITFLGCSGSSKLNPICSAITK